MRCYLLSLACALAAPLATGCGRATPPATGVDPAAGIFAADPAATQEIQEEISRAVNDAGVRYLPLQYKFNENLLSILDQVESFLSGKAVGPAPRFLAGEGKRPGLDEREEADHFRETIRRWEAQTGKNLRDAIAPLKAEVAARKPDAPPTHPEFQERFSAAFDDFIKIEVEEMRERRNRAIHDQVRPLLEKYRATHPDLVRHFQGVLDTPPYQLSPSAAQATGGGRPVELRAGPGPSP